MNKKKIILIILIIVMFVVLYVKQTPIELKSTVSKEYLNGHYSLVARIKKCDKGNLSSEDLEPINNQEIIDRVLSFILNHQVTLTKRKTFKIDPVKQVKLYFRDDMAKKYMDIEILGENYVFIRTYNGKISVKRYVIKDKINIDHLIELLSNR